MSRLTVELVMVGLLVAGYFWWRHVTRGAVQEMHDRVNKNLDDQVIAELLHDVPPTHCHGCDRVITKGISAPQGVYLLPSGQMLGITELTACVDCYRGEVAA